MRWRTKLLVLLLAFAVAPMVVIAMLGFGTLEQTARNGTLDGVEAVASARAEAIDQFTESRRHDVERMAGLVAPSLQRLHEAQKESSARHAPAEDLPRLEDAEDIGSNRPADATSDAAVEKPRLDAEETGVDRSRDGLSKTLGLLLWDQRQFEELLVIGTDGVVLASTFADHVGHQAAELGYFQSGRRATFVQPVFISPITEQLTMVIATPIRSENRQTIGVLAARLNLTGFFRLINDYTGLGISGETVVAKKIDDEVVFMAPTRHDDDAALKRTLPLGATIAEPMQDAVRGQSGRGLATDYRGVRVFAAWHHIPALEWGLVTKIDYDEATAPVKAARSRTVFITLVVMALVVCASLVAAQALVAPLRQLRDATERISKGDFDVELDIHSGGEIGELADSFERMVAAIKFFRERHSTIDEEGLVDDEPPEGT